MLQRILGGVLVLVGLVAAALGVASATVWRDTDTVVATAKPTGDGTLVVTFPDRHTETTRPIGLLAERFRERFDAA